MRMLVSVDVWKHALLTALALSPVAACGGSTNVGTGGGSTGTSAACKDEAPVIVAGTDSGYASCTGQWQHRPSVVACPSEIPRAGATCSLAGTGGSTGAQVDCTQDSDCTAQPNGYCNDSNGELWGCFCNYGCVQDSDCGANQICLCGSPVGHCVQATCKSDADCPGGLCATYTSEPGCGGTAFACQSPKDECTGDGDCPQGQQCTLSGDHRVCESPTCAIGRPFLIWGEERLAPLAARGDWLASGLAPRTDHLGEVERQALSARWAEVGLMEHASVAAFARFVLQLLSLGAPPDLVRDAQAAMADETRHAEICFALASAYGDRAMGPGPLSIDGAMETSDPRSILVTAIHEGCVGETVAAIEAAEMAARAEDPVVREALTAIAADETRHAELAWRYVRWAIGQNANLASAAREAFGRALSGSGYEGASGDEGALIAHGIAGEGLRREIRRRALEGVVGPCRDAMFASREPRHAEARPLHA
jgi:hypothetical protein